MCEDKFEEYEEDDYEICNDCGCKINYDEAIEVYDFKVCSSCANNYYTCEGCGRLFQEGDVSYNDEGECYCRDCQDRDIPDYDSNGNSDWWRDE